MGSFGPGAKLRQERIDHGLTIDDVARETRIRPRFLVAIEADDFDGLPGAVFARSFVRQYAKAIGLDPDPLVAEMPKREDAAVQLPNPPARQSRPFLISAGVERAMRSGGWIAIVGVAAVLGWIYLNHTGQSAGINQVRPAERQPAQNAQTASVTPASSQPESSTQAATQTVPAPAVLEKTPAAPVEVVITAHQTTWVQVIADGKSAFTGTLQPNDTKEVGASDQVKLIAGNAGGITVSLNGKTLDPLGPTGQVRVLRLTAEGPVFLAKAPQPAPDPL